MLAYRVSGYNVNGYPDPNMLLTNDTQSFTLNINYLVAPFNIQVDRSQEYL